MPILRAKSFLVRVSCKYKSLCKDTGTPFLKTSSNAGILRSNFAFLISFKKRYCLVCNPSSCMCPSSPNGGEPTVSRRIIEFSMYSAMQKSTSLPPIFIGGEWSAAGSTTTFPSSFIKHFNTERVSSPISNIRISSSLLTAPRSCANILSALPLFITFCGALPNAVFTRAVSSSTYSLPTCEGCTNDSRTSSK